MWSGFPQLRPMATLIHDSLNWYGIDPFGGSVHDVIGTRCDPYTHALLSGGQYHHCCHSNLTRALARETGLTLEQAESHVHDVLNVFMCTGFTRDTGQYFMKASPVQPGDYLEFFADIDLLGALSACPGGDCSTKHSSDVADCYPLLIEVFAAQKDALAGWGAPAINTNDKSHGSRHRRSSAAINSYEYILAGQNCAAIRQLRSQGSRDDPSSSPMQSTRLIWDSRVLQLPSAPILGFQFSNHSCHRRSQAVAVRCRRPETGLSKRFYADCPPLKAAA